MLGQAREPKAMADVDVRHLLNGQPNGPVQTQRRMVYKDRKGTYYIKIYGRRHNVERQGTDPRFTLTHYGRTA